MANPIPYALKVRYTNTTTGPDVDITTNELNRMARVPIRAVSTAAPDDEDVKNDSGSDDDGQGSGNGGQGFGDANDMKLTVDPHYFFATATLTTTLGASLGQNDKVGYIVQCSTDAEFNHLTGTAEFPAATASTQQLSADIEMLSPATTYYVRPVAIINGNRAFIYGNTTTVTMPAITNQLDVAFSYQDGSGFCVTNASTDFKQLLHGRYDGNYSARMKVRRPYSSSYSAFDVVVKPDYDASTGECISASFIGAAFDLQPSTQYEAEVELTIAFDNQKKYTYVGSGATTSTDTEDVVWLGGNTLWRAYNLGATSPEASGNYYAWGETTTKSNYTASTYQYYNSSSSSYTSIGTSIYGNTRYDAAMASTNGRWRLPSIAEMSELLNHNHWLMMKNGVAGYAFYFHHDQLGDNQNKSIFLPTAGYKSGTATTEGGYYWTGNQSSSSTTYARVLMWNSSTTPTTTKTYARRLGLPIRPVRNL